MNRTIVIELLNDEYRDNVRKNVDILMANASCKDIVVLTAQPDSNFNIAHECTTCHSLCYPNDCDTFPKRRNWLNQYFKTQQYSGMLHVLEQSTKLLEAPNVFLDQLEDMMSKLDYSVWFNTICDPCNYVYNKYCPRMSITLDDYAKDFKFDKLLFTSHSNTSWIAYDFSKVQDDLLKFNELFTIPMYYIIEFLARRRNSKLSKLYYMNQYLTVPAEKGVFKHEQIGSVKDKVGDIKQEDAEFKQLNINYAPDNNIDNILETFYEMLKGRHHD